MITAYRDYHKHYTATRFTLPDGTPMMFLELPWRDNEIGKSCIPDGVYIIDRDTTGKHKWYRFRNEQTDPRTHIELHPASLVRHLEGCLAPCYSILGGTRTADPVAVGSLKACNTLVDWFGDDSWVLELTS